MTPPDLKTLLPIAYRAASQVVRRRLLAEEASERAMHLFTVAVLEGHAPDHPHAWLRSVARRSAFALLKSDWARMKTLDDEDLQQHQTPYRAPRSVGIEQLRENLEACLSPRQNDALAAAGRCNGTRAAARSCGMQPRDFRRHLVAITRKAQSVFEDRLLTDPHADDPGVLFELDT
jgi:hypothetical protein